MDVWWKQREWWSCHHEIPQAKKQKTLKQNKQAFAWSTKWKCNKKKTHYDDPFM
jgi:hypothetical protein